VKIHRTGYTISQGGPAVCSRNCLIVGRPSNGKR
jgi:hypothetical protein